MSDVINHLLAMEGGGYYFYLEKNTMVYHVKKMTNTLLLIRVIMDIRDPKAEYLEEKGFYRRAAARWAEIMVLLSNDSERKLAAQKRAFCINKSLRNNLQVDNYSDIKQGIYKAYKKMGLVNERIFRNYKGN